MTQAADPRSTTPAAADRQAFDDAFSKASTRLHVGTLARENLLSAAAMVLAVVSAVLISAPSLHILGGWLGLAGILTGLYAQLTSATTAERVVNVTAIGIAAVSFAFHIHHGGLF